MDFPNIRLIKVPPIILGLHFSFSLCHFNENPKINKETKRMKAGDETAQSNTWLMKGSQTFLMPLRS